MRSSQSLWLVAGSPLPKFSVTTVCCTESPGWKDLSQVAAEKGEKTVGLVAEASAVAADSEGLGLVQGLWAGWGHCLFL